MNSYREILLSILWRTLISIPVFAIGFRILATVRWGWSMVPEVVFGAGLVVAGAVIIAPPVATLIAEPLGAIFTPSRRSIRANTICRIAEGKRRKGNFKEAYDMLSGVAEEYPHEVRPYIDMIDLAAVDLQDIKLAESAFDRGIVALHNEDDRSVLAQMYHEIMSNVDVDALRAAAAAKEEQKQDEEGRDSSGDFPVA